MGSMTVRKLDDALMAALRQRAEAHGRSMESEVRVILHNVVLGDGPGKAWLELADECRGPHLPVPPRSTPRPVEPL